MQCYYEVLQVPMDATDSEIKSSYRKLALRWHPDKNLENLEEAKAQFQIVQQAYEVLSDGQERAWYDRHREQILRSKSGYEDNCLDVFQYFTTSCFKGYNDSEKGFYTVYRNVFETIGKEDMEFLKKDEFCDIPNFGNSTSVYDGVVGPFYDYWMSYSTKKSFAWLDPHNITEIRDRRIMKLVEKENKKVRQKARKERNEEIRNLVAFVRKRDKRVQLHLKLMNEKILANREKQNELRKQKKLENKQNLESTSQPEWAKFDNLQDKLEQIERNFEEEEDTSESQYLFCVACNKYFKTVKTFENHESSKKHKENVARIRSEMLEDDERAANTNSGEQSDEMESESIDEYLDDANENPDLLECEQVNGDDDYESIDDLVVPEVKTKKKKNKKSKAVLLVDDSEHVEESVLEPDDLDDFSNGSSKKKRNKKSNKKPKQEGDLNCNTSQDVVNEANGDTQKSDEGNAEVNGLVKNGDSDLEEDVSNKMSKKNRKGKRQKNEQVQEIDVNLTCVTCKANFKSKNKLFAHLKATKHGVAIAEGCSKKSSIK